jgi:MFS transporter, DHA2 family, methylenomycin A resistance protein
MVSLAARTRLASRRSTTVILLCLGVFIAQLDSQVVNLAIKHIGSDLNAGISRLQWVMDSPAARSATCMAACASSPSASA